MLGGVRLPWCGNPSCRQRCSSRNRLEVQIGSECGGFGERTSSPRRGRSREQSNEDASIAGLLQAGTRFSVAVNPAHVEAGVLACPAAKISRFHDVPSQKRNRTAISTPFRRPVSPAVVKPHRAEMAVVLLAAVGTVQMPPVGTARRIAPRDRNVAPAGTGNQEHLRRGRSLCGTRFRICRRLRHGS